MINIRRWSVPSDLHYFIASTVTKHSYIIAVNTCDFYAELGQYMKERFTGKRGCSLFIFILIIIKYLYNCNFVIFAVLNIVNYVKIAWEFGDSGFVIYRKFCFVLGSSMSFFSCRVVWVGCLWIL